MHNSVDPLRYEFFSFLHESQELFVSDAGDLLQEGACHEWEYGETYQIGYEMKWVDRVYFPLFSCFLELPEHVGPYRGYFIVELSGDAGGVVPDLVEDEHGQVGVGAEKVDVGPDELPELFFHGDALVGEIDGDAFYELPEVVHHDDVEQFFLAAEIVVEQGQVDAGFFGDVAGADGGEAFLGEKLFGGLHDLLFRGYAGIDR